MTDQSGAQRRVVGERFVAGGDLLSRDGDGRVVFVRGAVPGDEMSVEITEDRGSWCRGHLTTLHVSGERRVDPPCLRRRQGCGGCDWQHVADQMSAKADIVVDALRRTAHLPDAITTIGGSVPSEGYRTSIRVVGDESGRAAFRHDRSHDTVVASGCLVAHPTLHRVLDSIRITPGLEVALRVSAATGEMTARWDRRAGEVSGLDHTVNTGRGAHLVEVVAGQRFRVSAPSFFQSGPAAAELLVDAVRRAVPEIETASSIADLYAGVGLFALAAVPPTARVVAVESARSSVADARVNLADRDAVIIGSEVGRWKPRGHIDVVIADPARSGLGKPGVNALVRSRAELVALVSCDPVSLARDTALLTGRGYRHVSTEILDLFPQTHHVECVTRFERG